MTRECVGSKQKNNQRRLEQKWELTLRDGLDQALLLQVLVRLAVVNVSFFVLKLLHCLLLEDLNSSFPFQFLCH